MERFIIGLDEVGRAAPKGASLAPQYIVGIDEVGRGALAGPVTVVAACIPVTLKFSVVPAPDRSRGQASTGIRILRNLKLKDSKKLTKKQRESWFAHFKNHPQIGYAIASVYPRTIEKINMSKAANLAAQRAYDRLVHGARFMIHETKGKLTARNCRVFLDGGLYLGNGKRDMLNGVVSKTVIKGDERIPAISVASIIAKVSRDRAMNRLAKKYPNYGLGVHKGYGTKKHIAAIKKNGPATIHRLTFLKA